MTRSADAAATLPPDLPLSEIDSQDLARHFAGTSGSVVPDLRQLWATIRANLWLIAAIIAAALAIAVIATFLQTPRYTAVATVQINDQSDRVLKEGDDVSGMAVDMYDADRFLQTQLDILRSRGLALRVAQSLKLIGDPTFYKAMGGDAPPPSAPAAVARNAAIGLLLGNLDARLPRTSRIVAVSFESTDPQLAARIANGFVREFIAANLQRKYDSSAYARNFISDQLSEAKVRLENSEQALNGYARQAGLFRTGSILLSGSDKDGADGGGGSVTTDSLVQLNRAANDARAARVEAQGQWETLQRSGLNSPQVLTNSSVQALLTQRADVQAKLQQEQANHLDDYPSVLALKAQAAEVDRQLAVIVGAVKASVRSKYEASLATERNLTAQVSELKGASLAEQDRAVKYNILAREVSTNRTIYDGLLQRFKELNAAAGISASNVSIIDVAEPPLAPSSPRLMLNLAIGLLIGGMAAGVLVLIRSQFDDSISVPEDIEQKLHLPLLGVVPKTDDVPEQALSDPKSPISEAYNSLGGSLLYATSDGLPPVLLITSAQPTEGKSTTSLALANGFARIGRTVVLIDADLRRPSLHGRSGISNKRGLTTLLTSHDSVESVLISTDQPGLSLVPSGPVPPSPTELIASPRMQAVLDELSDKFDVVVIDSPPILGLADAPLLAPLVDGVVMVVEADRGRRGSLKASLRRLKAMRPMLLGAVLTKFDPRKSTSRYSDYYGYDYYHYKPDEAHGGETLG